MVGGVGFGDAGQARRNYDEMVKGMKCPTEIEENVEHDAVNSERYMKELSKVCWEMFRAGPWGHARARAPQVHQPVRGNRRWCSFLSLTA